ncbi:MAG: sulfite exporter TauE/SafE family protein [Parcubacteria group bacterium]|nr:sulfite exporter TauE/SafE family protein [Parcubacteria group bacterium]
MDFSLVIPAFIAGVLTFLAPCTLPLVPGYLGFISGVSAQDLQDPLKSKSARKKIFLNGLLFVVGFSLVFILLGSLFGLGGSVLAQYRIWLSRIGGIFVILFGLFMMGVLRLPFLNVEKNIGRIKALKPGNPASSLIFGATFAFGWTPCVGPILGSILTLAAASATVGQGAFLLSVFSLGLAVPFLIIAIGIGSASNHISKLSKYLNIISMIGGLFLIFLGILLLTNKLGVWIAYFYQWFNFINYERLLDYL